MMQTYKDLLKAAENDLDMILGSYRFSPYAPDRDRLIRTVTAIKEVLKEPEQEPVAWLWKRCYSTGGYTKKVFDQESDARDMAKGSESLPIKDTIVPLYTVPPHHEWIGLTDIEINKVARKLQRQQPNLTHAWWESAFANAIIDKYKEKNK